MYLTCLSTRIWGILGPFCSDFTFIRRENDFRGGKEAGCFFFPLVLFRPFLNRVGNAEAEHPRQMTEKKQHQLASSLLNTAGSYRMHSPGQRMLE